jgi:hypothetical protein
MLTQKAQIRRTAIFVVLVYLFLSVFITVGMGGHTAQHGHDSHHAAQHASFACAWMCASSSFVHSSDHFQNQSVQPYIENLAIYHERFPNPLSIFSVHIRPPPLSIA